MSNLMLSRETIGEYTKAWVTRHLVKKHSWCGCQTAVPWAQYGDLVIHMAETPRALYILPIHKDIDPEPPDPGWIIDHAALRVYEDHIETTLKENCGEDILMYVTDMIIFIQRAAKSKDCGGETNA